MFNGGCFCGAVRYEATGTPFYETNCHCSICRRTSGAAFVTWFSVLAADFRFTSGVPGSLKSSDHATRTFCPSCGTPLTFQSDRSPSEIDITTCSLDTPDAVPPQDHTYVRSKLSWVHIDDGLPVFAKNRSQ